MEAEIIFGEILCTTNTDVTIALRHSQMNKISTVYGVFHVTA